MPKYGRKTATGAYVDIRAGQSLESVESLFHPATRAAWAAAGEGFRVVPDALLDGGTVSDDGVTVTNLPPPAAVVIVPPSVTRARFEAIFAGAIGEVEFDDILDALAAIAATASKSPQTVMVKRALRALDAAAEIDFPRSPYKTAPAANDLTSQFLAVVRAAIGTTPAKLAAITAQIDAGLAAWSAASGG